MKKKSKSTKSKRSVAFRGDVYTWCAQHDQHSPEGWLYLVLDGTVGLEEMRRAILEDRAPKEKP